MGDNGEIGLVDEQIDEKVRDKAAGGRALCHFTIMAGVSVTRKTVVCIEFCVTLAPHVF